jgi:hypothetical protein
MIGLLAQVLEPGVKRQRMKDYFYRGGKKFTPFHMLLLFYILIALAGVMYRVLK